jgi:hypothetical protein
MTQFPAPTGFTGVYVNVAARLLEPSLLALAVLAIRGRVKL